MNNMDNSNENKAVKLYNSITNIKDEHIEAAGSPETDQKKKNKGRRAALGFIGLAACLGLAIFAGVKLLPKKPHIDPNLPMLTISEEDYGMGFEGYMAKDISELVSGNPWSEKAKLQTLPVYENKVKYDMFMNATGYDLDAMKDYLEELIDKLGMGRDSLVYDDNTPIPKQIEATMKDLEAMGMLPVPDDYFAPTELSASDGRIKVSVDEHMDMWISFEDGIALPPEYNFGYHAPLGDMEAVAQYLKEKYLCGEFKDIIGMENPQIDIYDGDYNIYGQQGYHIAFFEKGGNMEESIINYNLKEVLFSCDDDGRLMTISLRKSSSIDKVGDYPIISAERARELLLEGRYATSVVQWDMPGEEYISKVELIYRTSKRSEFYMPYYRFFIELPEDYREEQGLKTYGAYYVPAIEEKYIENMPTYDGSMNN